MKRLFVTVSVVTALVFGGASNAFADQHGGAPRTTGNKLVAAWNAALLSATESDPWIIDDGCTGGTGEKDPGFFLMALVDPPVKSSHCTVSEDAPLVFVPAGVTCWQATVALAKDECETAWADPSAALLESAVVIDGKPQKLPLFRTTQSTFTFPAGAIIDTPGTTWSLYGINQAVIVKLSEGRHVVELSARYADGLFGDTTFTIDVTD